MKRGIAILLVVALMVGVVVGGTACESCLRPAEGQLPTYNVEDTWTWTYVYPGTQTEFTMTEAVTGEETVGGRDCYVIDMSFDPAMSWPGEDTTTCTMTGMTYWQDKATALYGVEMEMSVTCNGATYTNTDTFSYDPWTPLFPLEVGNEVSTQMTTHSYWDGTLLPGSPFTITQEYEVVDKDDIITVAAGSFGCWKIDIYEGDAFAGSFWFSDVVKSSVLMVDGNGVTIMELLSYSVQ